MDVVREFRDDCTSSIEALQHNSPSLPRPTIFLMGLGIGVIAARIAGTCAELRR